MNDKERMKVTKHFNTLMQKYTDKIKRKISAHPLYFYEVNDVLFHVKDKNTVDVGLVFEDMGAQWIDFKRNKDKKGVHVSFCTPGLEQGKGFIEKKLNKTINRFFNDSEEVLDALLSEEDKDIKVYQKKGR